LKGYELRLVVFISLFMLVRLSGKKTATLTAFFTAHHATSDRLRGRQRKRLRQPTAE
jgi:hypothetical protein